MGAKVGFGLARDELGMIVKPRLGSGGGRGLGTVAPRNRVQYRQGLGCIILHDRRRFGLALQLGRPTAQGGQHREDVIRQPDRQLPNMRHLPQKAKQRFALLARRNGISGRARGRMRFLRLASPRQAAR